VRQGDTVTGTVTVHRLNGSSTAKTLSVDIRSQQHSHWASAQVASNGHSSAFSPGACFNADSYGREISISDCRYAYILGDDTEAKCNYGYEPQHNFVVAGEMHRLDFEVKVPNDIIRNFRTYYATFETSLVIELGFSHPEEMRGCMPAFATETNDADEFEHRLWHPDYPLDHPHVVYDELFLPLVARIPITVVGDESSEADAFSNSFPVDYLTSGTPSPLVLARSPSSGENIVFPVLSPVITPEPIANTTQRMLSMYNELSWEELSEPTRNYHQGAYVGLLWQKKVLAERLATHSDAPVDGTSENIPQRFFRASQGN